MSEEETKVEAAAEAAVSKDSTTAQAAPKKKKKWPIVTSVVAIVLIAAGAGFFVWHEQPSFCNAICHTPMDPYLPTFASEPGQASMDKWGNDVANASGMLSATHRVEGKTCMSCHVPTIGEQMSEGVAWVSGNYYVPLEEKDLTQLVEARGLEADQFCLNESCHNLTREDLVAATADKGDYNPHVAQHTELTCSSCHKAHRASVNACTQCHVDAYVPEGWLTSTQERDLEFV